MGDAMLPTLLHVIAFPLAELGNRLWYALPLLVSVSLVYAATRHEELPPILNHAWRFALWIALFMGGVAGVVQLITWAL